ncbi:MAG: hypothetical protein CMJ58_02940 [Planctomycetaceae bacterium]|nr:hypothetical protein [Planctomycetaceae bacterium]
MKRLLPLIVISLVAGVGLGAALGYYDARPWAFHVTPSATPQPVDEPQSDAAPADGPRAVVDESTFHFDKMERGTKMRHEFEIRNTGEATLSIDYVSHTCKCTKVELNGKEVEPGAEIDVAPGDSAVAALEWEAKTAAGPFRHGGTFNTNDPAHSRIELIVEGDVVESTTLQPPLLRFEAVPVAETGTAEILVVAYMEPEVVIESYEFDDPDFAARTTVTVEPVAKEDLPEDASAAARVRVEYHPNGVIGQFFSGLHLKTNLKKAPELVVPAFVLVRGEVSIYGVGWTRERGVLRMPTISAQSGGEVDLLVNVRGDLAAQGELQIAEVSPEPLQAELGAPKQLRGELRQYPLKVSIPKGARPMVRMGEDHGGDGLIVLKSTVPDAPEFRMRVQFRVTP